MDIEILSDVLLWSAVVNYGILLLWFVLIVFAHDWMYRLHSRWFSLSVAQFDTIHYACMALYKLGIILFFLVPYIVLTCID